MEIPSRIQCPSARPEMPGSAAFGVVLGTVEQPHVSYLEHPVPVTADLLALAQPVAPTEVFRFAAPCAGRACQHFDGSSCRLATRIVEQIPATTASLPECGIRETCRWWLQEGAEACYRCPLIATESLGATVIADPLRIAADPTAPVASRLPIVR